MGKRLRLAEGLLNDNLSKDEKEEALGNPVIVKMNEDMKKASSIRTKKEVRKNV